MGQEKLRSPSYCAGFTIPRVGQLHSTASIYDNTQRNVSVVFQDFGRYQLTVRENIWLGNIRVPPEDRCLEAAIHKSGIRPFISQLPTVTTPSWENGSMEVKN